MKPKVEDGEESPMKKKPRKDSEVLQTEGDLAELGDEVVLTLKEKFKALDETKKKAFVKYVRWKFSLYNHSNLHEAT